MLSQTTIWSLLLLFVISIPLITRAQATTSTTTAKKTVTVVYDDNYNGDRAIVSLQPSPSPSSGGATLSATDINLIIGGSVGGFIVLCVAIACFVFIVRRRQRQATALHGSMRYIAKSQDAIPKPVRIETDEERRRRRREKRRKQKEMMDRARQSVMYHLGMVPVVGPPQRTTELQSSTSPKPSLGRPSPMGTAVTAILPSPNMRDRSASSSYKNLGPLGSQGQLAAVGPPALDSEARPRGPSIGLYDMRPRGASSSLNDVSRRPPPTPFNAADAAPTPPKRDAKHITKPVRNVRETLIVDHDTNMVAEFDAPIVGSIGSQVSQSPGRINDLAQLLMQHLSNFKDNQTLGQQQSSPSLDATLIVEVDQAPTSRQPPTNKPPHL